MSAMTTCELRMRWFYPPSRALLLAGALLELEGSLHVPP